MKKLSKIALSRGWGKTTLGYIEVFKELFKKNPRECLRRAIVDELKKDAK